VWASGWSRGRRATGASSGYGRNPGLGLLTSPALVHALEPVGCFAGGRKVAAYVGLDPMEYSSGEKQRFGSISKGGSRLLRYLLVEAAQTAVRRDEELKGFYLAAPPPPGRTEGEGGGGQEAVDPGLYHLARRDRLRGVPPPGCRSAACPACNIGHGAWGL
jgi:hypothetical protein